MPVTIFISCAYALHDLGFRESTGPQSLSGRAASWFRQLGLSSKAVIPFGLGAGISPRVIVRRLAECNRAFIIAAIGQASFKT